MRSAQNRAAFPITMEEVFVGHGACYLVATSKIFIEIVTDGLQSPQLAARRRIRANVNYFHLVSPHIMVPHKLVNDPLCSVSQHPAQGYALGRH